jgi:hypothetical protein
MIKEEVRQACLQLQREGKSRSHHRIIKVLGYGSSRDVGRLKAELIADGMIAPDGETDDPQELAQEAIEDILEARGVVLTRPLPEPDAERLQAEMDRLRGEATFLQERDYLVQMAANYDAWAACAQVGDRWAYQEGHAIGELVSTGMAITELRQSGPSVMQAALARAREMTRHYHRLQEAKQAHASEGNSHG